MKKSFLTLCAAAFINSSFASDDTQLRTGILYDQTTQSVVTMLPDGGVAAIDIQSGENRWLSAAADKPLAIVDGQLISQKQSPKPQELTLVFQNLNTGDALNNVNLAMPSGVAPTVVDGAAHQFNLQWSHSAPSNQLQWTFRGGAAQGIAPAEAFTNRSASFSDGGQSGLIDLDLNARTASLNSRSITEVNARVVIEKQLLTDIPGRQFISQNGQHILVSNRIDSDTKLSYQWQLFDRSGQLLMQKVSAHSYAPFLVAGDQLLIIEPATGQVINGELHRNPPNLKAINLSSGQDSWSTSVRPIAYFGPMPL